jgi:hypothetical protein
MSGMATPSASEFHLRRWMTRMAWIHVCDRGDVAVWYTLPAGAHHMQERAGFGSRRLSYLMGLIQSGQSALPESGLDK